jgi:hypothetical protein
MFSLHSTGYRQFPSWAKPGREDARTAGTVRLMVATTGRAPGTSPDTASSWSTSVPADVRSRVRSCLLTTILPKSLAQTPLLNSARNRPTMAEFLPPHQAPISFEDFHNYTSQPLDDYNQFQSSQTIAPSHTATGLDFFSLEDPNALLAPHLDQFESELDNLTELDDPQLQLVALDQSEPYSFLRSDTPSAQQYRQPGPGSAFSESLSGYESISGYSESIYRPQSEYITSHRQLPTDYIVPDYIMDLTRIRLDAPVAYPAQKPSPPSMSTPRSSYSPRNSYGGMPPSPPQQQQQQQLMDQHYRQRSDSSGHEYGRPMRGSQSEYGGYAMRHPSLLVGMQPGRQGYVGRNGSPPSVSPSSTTSSTDASGLSIPLTPPVPLVPSLRGEPQVHAELVDDDPRRKYKCPNCPRCKCPASTSRWSLRY